jgi:hypothetical protein
MYRFRSPATLLATVADVFRNFLQSPYDNTAVISLPSKSLKPTTNHHLVPRSRMSGAVPLLTQYTFMAWCSVKVQGQLYIYLTICGDLHIWFDVISTVNEQTDMDNVCWRKTDTYFATNFLFVLPSYHSTVIYVTHRLPSCLIFYTD